MSSAVDFYISTNNNYPSSCQGEGLIWIFPLKTLFFGVVWAFTITDKVQSA